MTTRRGGWTEGLSGGHHRRCRQSAPVTVVRWADRLREMMRENQRVGGDPRKKNHDWRRCGWRAVTSLRLAGPSPTILPTSVWPFWDLIESERRPQRRRPDDWQSICPSLWGCVLEGSKSTSTRLRDALIGHFVSCRGMQVAQKTRPAGKQNPRQDGALWKHEELRSLSIRIAHMSSRGANRRWNRKVEFRQRSTSGGIDGTWQPRGQGQPGPGNWRARGPRPGPAGWGCHRCSHCRSPGSRNQEWYCRFHPGT